MKLLILLLVCTLHVIPSSNAQSKKNTKASTKKGKVVIAVKPKMPTSKAAAADTLPSKTVVVTASFKPTLQQSSKINLTATPLPKEVVMPDFVYNIPSKNVFVSYEPSPIKPLSLYIDSTIVWKNEAYVKVGYGNFATPFFEAAASLGNGTKQSIKIQANHISSTGNLAFQQFSKTGLGASGIFNSNTHTTQAALSFNQTNQYQYGFMPDTIKRFTKDSLQRRYNNFEASISFANQLANAQGITYKPSIQINQFSDNASASETNIVATAPFTKIINPNISASLALVGNITSYSNGNAAAINNNIFAVQPSISYNKNAITAIVGFSPTWNNSNLKWLPNIEVQGKLAKQQMAVFGGVKGSFLKNNYQYLTSINPFINPITNQTNTQITDVYAGVKGSVGSHWMYEGSLSFQQWKNAILFVNDSATGKAFIPLVEEKMVVTKLHAGIAYTLQEKLLFNAGLNLYDFQKNTTYADAWGYIPIELTSSLKLQLKKDIWIKSDLFFWDGAKYRNQLGQSQKLAAAFDWNVGVEAGLMPRLNLWCSFNNILNNKYQRWNQYAVLGTNVLVGVVYSFK